MYRCRRVSDGASTRLRADYKDTEESWDDRVVETDHRETRLTIPK